MVKHFRIFLFTFIFFCSGSLLYAIHSIEIPFAGNEQSDKSESISDLSVTKTSSTSVVLTWNSSGTGIYRITITNLITLQVEQDFTTSNTTASAGSLTTGHTYRFEVEQNGFVIAEDLVM